MVSSAVQFSEEKEGDPKKATSPFIGKSLWHYFPIVGDVVRAFNETYRHEPLEGVLQEFSET